MRGLVLGLKYLYSVLQCRERASSYKAKFAATFSWLIDGRHVGTVTSNIGQVPIMVKVCMKVIEYRVFAVMYVLVVLTLHT